MNSHNKKKTLDDVLLEKNLLFGALQSHSMRINLLEKSYNKLYAEYQKSLGAEQALLIIIALLNRHINVPLSKEDIQELFNTIHQVAVNEILGKSIIDQFDDEIQEGYSFIESLQEHNEQNNQNYRINFHDDQIH